MQLRKQVENMKHQNVLRVCQGCYDLCKMQIYQSKGVKESGVFLHYDFIIKR